MDIIVDRPDLKILRLELGLWSTNSYIVICPQTGKSTLIDAPAGARTILKHLKGTQLEWMLLTHCHEDHTGGLRAIRNQALAALAVHPAEDRRSLPFRPDMDLSHGDTLITGKIRIEVIFTPGHTPGSVCFKIGKYLLAGDTVFPGGPGRTANPEAFQQIIHSITGKLFTLPDETEIYPGHGSSTTLAAVKAEYSGFASRDHNPDLCGDVLWETA
jgi:hydroxyacylglutathione hydrolase